MDFLAVDKNMAQKRILNREEALAKLNELIELSGENIDFDYDSSEATITTQGNHKVKMKHIGEDNCFRYDTLGKNVGIFYKEISGHYDVCLLMHIVVKEGNNMRIYRLRQGDRGTGDIFMNDNLPRFDYFEYHDGLLYCFASDGHYLEIATSNNEMLVVKAILDIYGISDPTLRRSKITYKEIDFGAHLLPKNGKLYKDDFDYIPKVRLEYIQDNERMGRKIIIDYAGATIFERAYTLTRSKQRYSSSNIFPKCYYKNERDIGSTSNFDIDRRCLDYSVEVLQSKEGKDAYNTWKTFVSSQPVMAYINNYYGHLIYGLEYFQGEYVNPGDVQRITDARPCLRDFKQTPKAKLIAEKAKRLLSIQ